MRLIAILLILFTTQNLIAQKLYIWCPKDQGAVPRNGLLEGESINLVIFDGRHITKKSKVECTSDETIHSIANFIRESYPSAKMDIIDSQNYFKDPESKSNW